MREVLRVVMRVVLRVVVRVVLRLKQRLNRIDHVQWGTLFLNYDWLEVRTRMIMLNCCPNVEKV